MNPMVELYLWASTAFFGLLAIGCAVLISEVRRADKLDIHVIGFCIVMAGIGLMSISAVSAVK